MRKGEIIISKTKNEVGNRHGKLTVVSYAGKSKDRKAMWLCKCDCGREKIVTGKLLRNGSVVSCGCSKSFKHGLTKSPLYSVWSDMKQRCYNENNRHYKDYGGRGIEVCKEWHDVRVFFRDMLHDYNKHKLNHKTTQLDRIDNDKGYSKLNCRWVESFENANNTRNQKYFIAISPTGELYESNSQSIFARRHGLKPYGINKCLNNVNKTYKGWKFNYKKEGENYE